MKSLIKAIREPPAGTGASRVVVLLHGLGSDENDLLGLAAELDPAVRYVSYRAPLRHDPGYAWFDLSFGPMGFEMDQEQAIQSRDLLIDELETAQELAGLPIVMGGFSQGAIMTLGVAAKRPDLLSGAMLLSGLALPAFTADPDPAIRRVPFLIQHGVHDPVLPVSGARAARDFLQGLGAKVRYREYAMGHEVSHRSLADIANWLCEP